MSPLRNFFWGCSLLLLCATHAQGEFITLGKHQAHPTRILAKYNDQANMQARLMTLEGAGLKVAGEFELVPGLVVLDVADDRVQLAGADRIAQARLMLNRIDQLRNSGLFEYVEPNYVQRSLALPNDTRFGDGTLWGLRNTGAGGGVAGADIDAVRAWEITTGSRDVIVAVIDSGIRYTHRELAPQMWENPGEIANTGRDDNDDGYVDNVFGINAITRSGDPFDDNGHGTHVAGTIGAAANDGHPHVGVVWDVQLLAAKFLRAEGFGFTDEAIRCIDFAVLKGAKVLNNSWGGGPFQQALFDSISAANEAGVLFVAAAGNERNDNDRFPSYPASYQLDNVISVAAVNRRDELASFSNYGSRSVHVAAPGVEIFSTEARSDSDYQVYQGTSMAAPHVSGIAALIYSRFPDALLAEVRERIVGQAVPVAGLQDRVSSGGRVNAYRALSAEADGVLEVSVNPPEGTALLADSTVPIFVTVTDLFGVTDATVTGRIEGSDEEIAFVNDGTGPDRVADDAIYSGELIVPETPGEFTVILDITAPEKEPASLTVTYQVMDRPANDDFANAHKIAPEGGLLVATNKLATIEPWEPRHAGVPSVAASLWWTWSPNADGKVIIDTAGSSFDTVLGVYTNSTLPTLKEVASVDDVDSKLDGYVEFDAVRGVTYRIAVAGYSLDETGTIRLRVEPGGGPDETPPSLLINSPSSGLVITDPSRDRIVISGVAGDPQPNASGVKEVLVQVNNGIAIAASGTTNWASTNLLDVGVNTIRVVAGDYAGNVSRARTITVTYRPQEAPNLLFNRAVELAGSEGEVSLNTDGAAKEFGEPLHAGNEGGKSVWWFFRPERDGVLSLSTSGSTFDTLLGVYQGERVSALTEVASNDDAFAGVSYSEVTIAVQADQTYWIAVDGYGGESGMARLSYAFQPEAIHRLTLHTTEGGRVTPGSGWYASGTILSLQAVADPNYQFERWEWDITSTENPHTLIVERETEVRAVFTEFPFSDGFESGNLSRLNWTSAGARPWFVQSETVSAGQFAARSGAIGHSQSSSLILVETMRAGPISFDLKVSSEQHFDRLEFHMNNQLVERWSGEVDWLTFELQVPAGQNRLEWRYVKDVSKSHGEDAAFLDNLKLPLGPGIDAGTPAKLSLNVSSTGTVELIVTGQADQEYAIQVSDDLINWTTLSTQIAVGGIIRFSEQVTGEGTRFYRAVVFAP